MMNTHPRKQWVEEFDINAFCAEEAAEDAAEWKAFNALTYGERALACLFVGNHIDAQVYATLALVAATNKAARR
jgi:hypothetical protein